MQTYGVVSFLLGQEELRDNLHLLWLFPVFFLPLLYAMVTYNLRRGRWLIENGMLYRGRSPLFRLDEIEAVQVGLPDNWMTAVANLPLYIRGSGGIVFAAAARRQIIVIKLTNRRWMMWSGMQYVNAERFRDALVFVAPQKTIDPLPSGVLPLLKLINVNRVLHE